MVVSLLAALVFWLMNALNKDGYSEKISFPLRIQYDDSLYIPVQALPKKIAVNVSGNGWDLLRKSLSLDVTPIKYPIEKPLKSKVLNTSSLQDLVSDYIKDVRINYIVAENLELEFDKKLTKTIRIRVDSLGIPLKENYVVSSLINVNPRKITLVGPKSTLEEFGDVISVKIPGRRIQDNFDDEIKLNLPKNAQIKASKDKVNVSFEVAELLHN
ncbi:hypothetical protein SAMN04515674_102234 [Pseudarcicella hirudinis]|uniref:YbbR-like protein n=2 Tax=Pseudarcicella hirudinis TaxID=1079859 RepID=A0A1I5P3D7_9BACT|nr:hypothetical protein SAMN04515674_102234 [Pseudarcicella hirudinis]